MSAKFEDSSRSIPFDFSKFAKVMFRFLPVLVLALFLPFFLMFTLTPTELNFLTKADTEPELRLWLEPAKIVVTSGSEANFDIVAEFNSGGDLLPGVNFDIDSVGNMSLSNRRFVYDRPFRGRVVVGKLTVTPNQAGQMHIQIPMGLVTAGNYEKSVQTITSQATLIVK